MFLTSVAHELKTPLSVLRGNLEGLSEGVLTPMPERWAPLNREINRLTRLVNDLLLIETMRHSPPAWNRKHYDPREQLAALIVRFEPLADMKKAAMIVECQVQEVFLDQDRMEQILVNLVDNALRHTPGGGQIRIDLQQEEKPAQNNDQVQSSMLQWCIEDSGPGISLLSIPLVLQPFFRDPRSPGAGLGLAVSSALVQAQGGSLRIARSELGGARPNLYTPSPILKAC